MIRADELLTWLRGQLGRNDVADHLETLLADATLNDDLRLLHLSHSLWPQMPPMWRGRPLDIENLTAAANASRTGVEEDSEWLRSLSDGRALQFFDQRGYAALADLSGRWSEARNAYSTAWATVTGLGAPVAAVPNETRQLAVSTLLAFSADYRAELRREAPRLLDPVDWLLRAPWFLRFGSNPNQISEAQLEVLQQLDTTSRMEAISGSALNELGQIDLDRLRRGVFVTDAQRRLLNRMQVAAGAEVIVLGPGQRHAPPGSRSALAETLAAMWHWVPRQWRWLRRMLRRSRGTGSLAASPEPTPPSETPAAQPPMQIELRMVRVTPTGEHALADIEAYVARLSWRAPGDSQHRLRVTYPGWLRVPKLTTGLLPPEGQTLLLLSEPCRVQLIRRLGLFRWQRSAPIDVGFTPMASPVEAGKSMVHATGGGWLASPFTGTTLAMVGTPLTWQTSGVQPQAPGATLRLAGAMQTYRAAPMRPAEPSHSMIHARSLTEREVLVAKWLNWPLPGGLLLHLHDALQSIGGQLGRRFKQHGRN